MDRAHLDASIQQLKHDLEILKLRGNSASISISGDGAIAVMVGFVAIFSLIVAAALSFVSWQQSKLLSVQQQEIRDRLEMSEAKQILAERRLQKLEGTKP